MPISLCFWSRSTQLEALQLAIALAPDCSLRGTAAMDAIVAEILPHLPQSGKTAIMAQICSPEASTTLTALIILVSGLSSVKFAANQRHV